jgi:hypothetical protein
MRRDRRWHRRHPRRWQFDIAPLRILNARNIQTQGAVTGLSTARGPPVGALAAARNAANTAVRTEGPSTHTGDVLFDSI